MHIDNCMNKYIYICRERETIYIYIYTYIDVMYLYVYWVYKCIYIYNIHIYKERSSAEGPGGAPAPPWATAAAAVGPWRRGGRRGEGGGEGIDWLEICIGKMKRGKKIKPKQTKQNPKIKCTKLDPKY